MHMRGFSVFALAFLLGVGGHSLAAQETKGEEKKEEKKVEQPVKEEPKAAPAVYKVGIDGAT
jgi:hypothetical protein